MSAPKKAAPADLNLVDLDGKKVHLKDYRGKLVVLNFWATWCVPCRDEMPMFVEVEKAWTSKGVIFIGASLDDKKSVKAIPEFMQKYKIDFPVWTGTTGDDMDHLKMGDAVPDTAFLDEEGVILARVQGEIKKSELVERLEWLTSDRKGPAPQALVRNLP
jgi:thiol-disulfide isomerase/thioredoxin